MIIECSYFDFFCQMYFCISEGQRALPRGDQHDVCGRTHDGCRRGALWPTPQVANHHHHHHASSLDSIAVSVFVFILVELESESNPNNNLMMRRAGLSNHHHYHGLPAHSHHDKKPTIVGICQ